MISSLFGCTVFFAACGLSLAVASRGCFSLWCMGLLWWFLLLQSAGSRHAGLNSWGIVGVQRLGSGFVAPRHVESSMQGSNLCPLHWWADSYPLYHPGSPWCLYIYSLKPSDMIFGSKALFTFYFDNCCRIAFWNRCDNSLF